MHACTHTHMSTLTLPSSLHSHHALLRTQDPPSVPHDITVLRLMPEMHSTASHTLFQAALQESPAAITSSPPNLLPLGTSPGQPPLDCYRRSLYSSSEDKSDNDDVDPEPLPSPYPTTQQVRMEGDAYTLHAGTQRVLRHRLHGAGGCSWSKIVM